MSAYVSPTASTLPPPPAVCCETAHRRVRLAVLGGHLEKIGYDALADDCRRTAYLGTAEASASLAQVAYEKAATARDAFATFIRDHGADLDERSRVLVRMRQARCVCAVDAAFEAQAEAQAELRAEEEAAKAERANESNQG